MATGITSTPTGDHYIDGVLYGMHWSGSVTYSFADDLGDFGPAYPYAVTGFQQVSLQQQNAIQSILEGKVDSGTAMFTYGSFAQVSLLDISLTSGSSDVTIGQADFFDGSNLPTARVADFPGEVPAGGDVWFGDDYASYRTPEVGTYSWLTHIHEFGHAMGLSHGHNAGTSIAGFELAIPHDRDGMEFSVMTYRSYLGSWTNGYTNEQYGYAQTLMMYDIAALQHLYGANFTTNAGNTTYTWSTTTGEMFVDGVGQGAPGDGVSAAANRLFLTIWDGGGEDTYDFSNYGDNAFIDLAPGGWSLVSQIQRAYLGQGAYANGNVYNALQYLGDLRSLIENAIGGSGNDEIAGNVGENMLTGNGGNDVLVGRGGDDELIGGTGNDTLYGDFRTPENPYTGTGLFTENGDASNSTRLTARDLNGAIGYRSDVNIEHSDTNPSVTVSGTGDGNHDWFFFDVKAPGQITLDIDGTLDSYIELYDANGNLLAFNDDASQDSGENRTNTFQSFIAYTVTTPGRYYVKVGTYPNGSVIGVGSLYTLGIVLPDPVEDDAGGSGNDTLDGGAGNDTLVGGAGDDTADGGSGQDVFVLDGNQADFTWVKNGNGTWTVTDTRPGNDEGTDTLKDIETLRFNDGTVNLTTTVNPPNLPQVTVIDGSGGNDFLPGTSGDDSISGYAGNDRIFAKGGNDTVYGGSGDDTIGGGAGDDELRGGNGDDLMFGGPGDDELYGGEGKDIVWAGPGNDLVRGGNGDDLVGGGLGNDEIHGGAGHDTLFGGAGADTLFGDKGKDELYGGAGQDRIIGGPGNDFLSGGADADTFVFAKGDGKDVIRDFDAAEGDRIDLGGQTYTVTTGTDGFALLELSGGGTILLEGVAPGDVLAKWFLAA